MKNMARTATLMTLAVLLTACSVFAQTPPQPAASTLGGTSWRLVKFQGSDDTTLTPDDPAKYTIAFGTDGSLSARIDCNRGRGKWKSSGPSQLELGPLALTRAKCPPGSLHDQIVKQSSYIRSYVLKDGHLFLSLMADGGIYEFEPAPPAAGGSGSVIKGTASYRERMALPPSAVFVAELEDVSKADAPAEVIARTEKASPGNPPIAFEIPYDPARIQANHTYVVRARILDGEKLLFTTTTSYPVLTRDKPNTVSVLLRRPVSAKGTPAPPPGPPAGARSLEKTYWAATELAGKPVAAAREPHLVFEQGSRVAGSDGCNRLTGTYELTGDTIKFGRMAATQMACPDTDATTERAFRDALQNASRLKLAGDGLELYDKAGTVVARFKARAKP